MKLSPLKKPQPPIDFAVCDIETADWTKFLILGHYDEQNNIQVFRSLKQYLKFLLDPNYSGPTIIFAHFGGKFDFLFLLREVLKDEKIKITSFIPRGSSILCFSIGNSITFRDSSALLPFGLASIAENFGVENKKGTIDYTKIKKVTPELITYLKSDLLSLHQSLKVFFQWPLIQKAGPSFTLASQAIKVLRLYLKQDIFRLPKSATKFCKKSYLGGRTEIFKPVHSKGALYEYDVNSLYPFVMREHCFPVDTGVLVFDFHATKLGIYECRVEAPKGLLIPCLGIVRDNKYIFPLGNFTGNFTSAEINYAITQGYKIKVIKGLVFNKTEFLFKDYINDLYAIRRLSKPKSVSDIIAKLLMNSCYGRFGMNLERENMTFDLREGVREYIDLKIKNKIVQIYKENIELHSFTHTAIASFVTSYARIHMHKLYLQCADELYYTDTDSIFTTKILPTGELLGDLKLENTFDSAVFLLPKTYLAKGIKTKIAMKGFDKKKIQNFTLQDFRDALEGDIKRLKITTEPKFATLKTALAQRKLVTMSKASTKELRAKYTKREIIKCDGEFLTVPLTIKEF